MHCSPVFKGLIPKQDIRQAMLLAPPYAQASGGAFFVSENSEYSESLNIRKSENRRIRI
jgi:hypothetical protein